jgi:hypothetical protein
MEESRLLGAVCAFLTSFSFPSARAERVSRLWGILRAREWIVCVLCCLSAHASAAIVFEFESPCTDTRRNTECAFFGLGSSDLVTGGLLVEDQFGAPGTISNLTNDQYQFIFTFGNQSFTEQDAVGTFNFLVSLDGMAISSILGNFQNANGAQLSLLTVSTANIALDGHEADTFGGGGGWTLAEDSGPFTDPVPLPASIWLFLSAVGTLGFILRRNDRSSSPA